MEVQTSIELNQRENRGKQRLVRLSGSIKVVHRVLIFVVARFVRNPFVFSSILSLRGFLLVLEPSHFDSASVSSSYACYQRRDEARTQ